MSTFVAIWLGIIALDIIAAAVLMYFKREGWGWLMIIAFVMLLAITGPA